VPTAHDYPWLKEDRRAFALDRAGVARHCDRLLAGGEPRTAAARLPPDREAVAARDRAQRRGRRRARRRSGGCSAFRSPGRSRSSRRRSSPGAAARPRPPRDRYAASLFAGLGGRPTSNARKIADGEQGSARLPFSTTSRRGDSPTSRNATTESGSVVQRVPAAKKVARSRCAPQRSGPRPGAYPAPSFFVGARCAIAASIVIPFPSREHTVEPWPSWVQKLGQSGSCIVTDIPDGNPTTLLLPPRLSSIRRIGFALSSVSRARANTRSAWSASNALERPR
jgi:hypothetical protein